MIDDDCLPSKDWLETMIQSCLKFKAEAGAGVYEETDTLLRDLRQKKEYPKEAMIDEADVVAIGGNVIFSRNLLDECPCQTGDRIRNICLHFKTNYNIL